MLTKEDILQEVKRQAIFQSKLFRHVWLVGSFAKDTATEKSDIDFLIDYNVKEIKKATLAEWSSALDLIEDKFKRKAQFISTEAFEVLGEKNYGIPIK